jgi:hypothetical protein
MVTGTKILNRYIFFAVAAFMVFFLLLWHDLFFIITNSGSDHGILLIILQQKGAQENRSAHNFFSIGREFSDGHEDTGVVIMKSMSENTALSWSQNV